MTPRRAWKFRALASGLTSRRVQEIFEWRAWLRDALNADPESLDDGPRLSDVQADCPACDGGVRSFGSYYCNACLKRKGLK